MLPKPRFYRFLEMIPASAVWITFFGAVIFSLVRPLFALYLIVLFDLLE